MVSASQVIHARGDRTIKFAINSLNTLLQQGTAASNLELLMQMQTVVQVGAQKNYCFGISLLCMYDRLSKDNKGLLTDQALCLSEEAGVPSL